MSSRNPTIKRILKESAELSTHPSPDFTAAPLDADLYEWHFTLRGPPSPSPFHNGIYHGRIILPPAYPLKPPSFRFLTPTGRFEVNREICLSISGHHEETWQPAWGIRTALVAIRSFMDSDARGQVGGMEAGEEVRRRLAGRSGEWRCGVCAKTNEEILREVEDAAKGKEGEGKEEVPEELRLAYREELDKRAEGQGTAAQAGTQTSAPPSQPPSEAQQPQPPAPAPAPAQAQAQQQPAQTQPRPPQQQAQPALQPQPEAVAPWIDKAIYGIVGALIFLIWKKFVV